MYVKQLENKKIYYQTKGPQSYGGLQKHFNQLFNEYLLDTISFNKNDIVVDCGANVGELFYSFEYKNLQIEYIGFEPDRKVYECLVKNVKSNQLINKALGQQNLITNLYIDSEGANTSLVDLVQTQTMKWSR